LNYRSSDEIAAGKASDPVSRMRAKLLQEGHMTQSGLDAMTQQIMREIDEAFAFALSSPAPTYRDGAGKIYA
jgi:pyruvate dehydrogenase E1 component alpha subunit